jgi:uncharacterized membrane protein YraQ (UPF0718 family)
MKKFPSVNDDDPKQGQDNIETNHSATMDRDKNKQKAKPGNIFSSIYRAFRNFSTVFPIFLGVILLVGLLRTYISPSTISSVFRGHIISDTLLASIIGSISAGNAVTSYIIGGELLKEGISLFAVTAFIVAWVTVGVVQFPAEAAILGKRFALLRNFLSFILSIGVAITTVVLLSLI